MKVLAKVKCFRCKGNLFLEREDGEDYFLCSGCARRFNLQGEEITPQVGGEVNWAVHRTLTLVGNPLNEAHTGADSGCDWADEIVGISSCLHCPFTVCRFDTEGRIKKDSWIKEHIKNE